MYQYESMERERDSDKETNNDHSEIDDSFFVFLVLSPFWGLIITYSTYVYYRYRYGNYKTQGGRRYIFIACASNVGRGACFLTLSLRIRVRVRSVSNLWSFGIAI
jgi:hypothetical protein